MQRTARWRRCRTLAIEGSHREPVRTAGVHEHAVNARHGTTTRSGYAAALRKRGSRSVWVDRDMTWDTTWLARPDGALGRPWKEACPAACAQRNPPGVCRRSCPPISCGVSDLRGAGVAFGLEPDGSRGVPVAVFCLTNAPGFARGHLHEEWRGWPAWRASGVTKRMALCRCSSLYHIAEDFTEAWGISLGGKALARPARAACAGSEQRLRERVGVTPWFSGLEAFGRIEARRDTDGRTTTETRYFALSSTSTTEALPDTVRTHRAIENALHWQLDSA